VGAICGIVGDADLAEIRDLSVRLAHRGSLAAQWRVGPRVHLGQRSFPGRPGSIQHGRPVALDGVLENRDEVAKLLNLSPEMREQESQEDLVFRLYQKLGQDCFQYLRGPFSVAIWDEEADLLMLARDFFGARSLYWAWADARFLFASEYKALLSVGTLAATPNLATLQFIASTRGAVPDASCLAGVSPVPPGHWLSVRGQHVERRRYWIPEVRIAHRSDADHVKAFRGAFMEAVRRQTAQHERLGVALSGGIDSASVVAGIRHVAPEHEIHTFVAGFGSEDPEVIGAAETARHFGTHHHPVIVPPTALPELLPEMSWHLEDPVGREDILYLYACARDAAASVDLLLGGHMADVLMGGMPRHMLVRLANLFPPARGPLADLFQYTRTGQPPRTALGKILLRKYFRGGIYPPPRVFGVAQMPLADEISVPGPEPLTHFLHRAVLSYPGKGHYDRIHSAFGVDLNAPFSDPELIKCTFQIPDHMKIRGRTQKLIQREAMKDLLPQSIRRRGKSLARLRNDLALAEVVDDLADQLLPAPTIRERGIFEVAYVDRVRRRPAGKPYSEEQLYRLWTLVLTEVWFRIFIDRRGAFPDARLW
jgi:asparagine synthase (glutamine-hydrolysing)